LHTEQKKLVLLPLKLAKAEGFIIWHGLDEADLDINDPSERGSTPEIRILIQELANFSLARLLFVSRAQANVSKLLPAYGSFSRPNAE